MTSSTSTAVRVPYRTISVAAAAKQGLRPIRISADGLAAWLPADGGIAPVWERIGYVHGVLVYGISHMRATETRVEIVREDGTVVMAYPLGQGRAVRILGA